MKTNLLKIIFLVIVTFGISNWVYAQGLYVGLDVGYALKMGSASNEQRTDAGSSRTYKTINYSLGKGFDAGLLIGYMFNKNVGAELGASYLIGGKTIITDKTDDEGSIRTREYTSKARMLRLNPSIVVAAGFEKIDPYAKFGLLIGIGSILREYTNKAGNDVYIEKQKDKGGVAFGLTAALGVDYNLNEQFAIFAEINMENMSYSPSKGELTEANQNGSDRLEAMTTSEKKFEYVNDYTYDFSNPPSSSEASKSTKFREPFGSIGLNIGVKVKL